jgi:putative endonuclease
MAEDAVRWFCYILECRDGSFYVGATSNFEERLARHNWGVGSKHTANRRPVKLVWQEEHASEREARGREAELKGWRREKKLKLIMTSGGIHPSPSGRAQDEFSSLRLENSGE